MSSIVECYFNRPYIYFLRSDSLIPMHCLAHCIGQTMTGETMDSLTFAVQGDCTVTIHDMGEEQVVLTQRNDLGQIETIALSVTQLEEALSVLSLRYRAKTLIHAA